MVLGHSHSHGGGHGHSHGHGQEGREEPVPVNEHHEEGLHQSHSTYDAEEGGSVRKKDNKRRRAKNADNRNINVRAAFIHTIGDLIQSLGVLLAAYIIKYRVRQALECRLLAFTSLSSSSQPIQPNWYFADPICTFIFSILVMISTITVLRDAMLVLMEGT